jgi:hypothetical protein
VGAKVFLKASHPEATKTRECCPGKRVRKDMKSAHMEFTLKGSNPVLIGKTIFHIFRMWSF